MDFFVFLFGLVGLFCLVGFSVCLFLWVFLMGWFFVLCLFLVGWFWFFFFSMTTKLRITIEHTTGPSIVFIINGNSMPYLHFAGGLATLLVLKH